MRAPTSHSVALHRGGLTQVIPHAAALRLCWGPVSTVAKPERESCAVCGFPLQGPLCGACGRGREPLPLEPGGARIRSAIERDVAGLEYAQEAFDAKDFTRAVDLVITVDSGGTARNLPAADGSAWVAILGGAAVFVMLRKTEGDLTLEAPVARLPQRQRVPVLRAALELTAREHVTSRFCLRGDLLLLRFAAPLAGLAPPLLRKLLREMGHLAARYAEVLGIGFEAGPALPEEGRSSIGLDALGEPRMLSFAGDEPSATKPRALEAAPAKEPPAKELPAKALPAKEMPAKEMPAKEPPRRDSVMDGKRPTTGPALRGKPIIPREEEETPSPPKGDSLPPILAPLFAASASSTSTAPMIPQAPPIPTGVAERRATTAPEAAVRRLSVGMRAVSIPDIELEAPTRRTGGSSAEISILPADRLCSLLQQARELAERALAERSTTMTWLVRSTVFRAIFDYRESLPDAVAHLYRCTGFARETGSSGASSASLPPAEPPIPVMDRIVAARAAVAKEKPITVDPLTSAAQVKEHVGRYVTEIEHAPLDPALRHFLALGALSELLVRTKLPSQTETRLREIVAHAQREGAKATSVDLLMTSLQRITA